MKRGLYFITLFLMLFFVFNVIAQENIPTTSYKYDFTTKTFTNSSQTFLEKEITIPSYLELPARIIFGLKPEDNFNFSIFIVLIAFWLFLLLILHSVMELIPFFGPGAKSWIGAIIVNCLIALSGGIKDSTLFFFDLGNTFTIMREQSILTLIFIVFLLMIIWLLLSKVIKVLKNKMGTEEAKVIGFKIGAGV